MSLNASDAREFHLHPDRKEPRNALEGFEVDPALDVITLAGSAGSQDYRALAAELFEPAHAPARVVRRVVPSDEEATFEPVGTSTPDAPMNAFERVRRALRWSGQMRPGSERTVERADDEPVGDLSEPER